MIVENCVCEVKVKLDYQIMVVWEIEFMVVDLEEVVYYDWIVLEIEMLFFFGVVLSVDFCDDIDCVIDILCGFLNFSNW